MVIKGIGEEHVGASVGVGDGRVADWGVGYCSVEMECRLLKISSFSLSYRIMPEDILHLHGGRRRNQRPPSPIKVGNFKSII